MKSKKPLQKAFPPGTTLDFRKIVKVVASDMYTVDVYCCNCDHIHFDAAIPLSEPALDCTVSCPNCKVLGKINNLHQVWPLERVKGGINDKQL